MDMKLTRRSVEVRLQQELCKMVSSEFQGINKLEVSPFIAVMRLLKMEYGLTKPEVYKMLISVLHDYDPASNTEQRERTKKYIRILLDENPDLADYLISVLPVPSSAADQTGPHALHSLQTNVPQQRPAIKRQSVLCSMEAGLEYKKSKKENIKFYNFTTPSVSEYVASQGIPQKIVHPISQGVTTLATPWVTHGLSPKLASTSSSIAEALQAQAMNHQGIPFPKIVIVSEGQGTSRVTTPIVSHPTGTMVPASDASTSKNLIPKQKHLLKEGYSIQSSPRSTVTLKKVQESMSTALAKVTSDITTASTAALSQSGGESTSYLTGLSSVVPHEGKSLKRNLTAFPYTQHMVLNGGHTQRLLVNPNLAAQLKDTASNTNLDQALASLQHLVHVAGPAMNGSSTASTSFSPSVISRQLKFHEVNPSTLQLPKHSKQKLLQTTTPTIKVETSTPVSDVGASVELSDSVEMSDNDDGASNSGQYEGASEPEQEDFAGILSIPSIDSFEPSKYLSRLTNTPSPPDCSDTWGANRNKEQRKRWKYYAGKRRRKKQNSSEKQASQ